MDIIKAFDSNLKICGIAIGISQEAFADKCGMYCIHRTFISAIKCYSRITSLENIQQTEDAFDIDTYKRFRGDIMIYTKEDYIETLKRFKNSYG